MPEKLLVPSIEQRLAAMVEVSRRMRGKTEAEKRMGRKPTITISREFGCEGYPVAEQLRELLEHSTREPWVVMDKALLEEAAKHHDISETVLQSLGQRPRFLDDMISTLMPRWKTERDHYKLLCDQIVSLAEVGNVIIIGRGSSIITQQMNNCLHFRIYASHHFKVRSIARRAKISIQDAELLVEKMQKERVKFIRSFLDRDIADLNLYHMAFNNDKNSEAQIARAIFDYLCQKIAG
ncbi:hypothetical protein GeomeDRAFT_2586 [Geobacter metallireducens RCH3]|uniref:Cytidylate kinase-like domain protein n=1 Tax=Geobacter metallireducens (strain ATCC 53774 / DSM 7210 / GS-15) TaxID=269799 RepID=Q39RR9_GEOMG|nr:MULTISPECIES: cytidylate kinase family protein [Geobacter]ABB33055.1 cytidylate kinase-like domain protein [Geobacter metallireducens GS-15]EHP85266.1 hypothetical protein GeomeDRAFT_2586 [Geobacter metallireducens RCH3]MBT1077271.1 cytidylate kinase family protein [Geobacter grbiciae]